MGNILGVIDTWFNWNRLMSQSVSRFSQPVVSFSQLVYYCRLLLTYGKEFSIEEGNNKSHSEVLINNKRNILFTIEGNQLYLYILRVRYYWQTFLYIFLGRHESLRVYLWFQRWFSNTPWCLKSSLRCPDMFSNILLLLLLYSSPSHQGSNLLQRPTRMPS
jgi:hypothetical protein